MHTARSVEMTRLLLEAGAPIHIANTTTGDGEMLGYQGRSAQRLREEYVRIGDILQGNIFRDIADYIRNHRNANW